MKWVDGGEMWAHFWGIHPGYPDTDRLIFQLCESEVPAQLHPCCFILIDPDQEAHLWGFPGLAGI